jgi:cell division protein FtsI (penicillin-binding protein 3)
MSDLVVRRWRLSYRRQPPASDGQDVQKRRLEIARSRLFVTAGVFLLCFGVLAVRTLDMAVVGPADARAHDVDGAGSEQIARADIVDRNGSLLASSLPTHSLYMEPWSMIDPEESALALAAALPDLDPHRLLRLATSGKKFAWVRRNLTPEQVHAVNRLGIPGLGFRREEQRVYPQGRLFAHAVGFTDVDNEGLAGLEKSVGEELQARAGGMNEPLTLSLDIRVQHALKDALDSAMTAHRAVGAAGIVMDATNGELLALVSLPSFDPNAPEQDGPNARFNRATLGTYELGSTFKAFTAAMALDLGAAEVGDSYDATKPLKVSRFSIRDSHPENRWLTVPEVLAYSSNIGAARMALDVGSERQQAFYKTLGMLEPMALELPERGRPIMPQRWNDLTTMTIGFGHGIAVTPLHMASGFAAMVNGGFKVTPTLLKGDGEVAEKRQRVISAETSAIMRKLLYLVVAEGTGKKAGAPGYLVGGKTGTAEKAIDGRYERKTLISTFVGAFPIDQPRYVVLAMLDEPKGNKATHGFATAGWTAAPVVGRVIERIGPLLGVAPSIIVDESEAGRPVVQISGEWARDAAF